MIPYLREFRLKAEAVVPRLRRADGNTTGYEQRVLATLVHGLRPKRVLEIGTFNGLSTLTMAMNTPGSITTVDIPQRMLGKTALPIVLQSHTYNDARYIRKRSIGEHFKGRGESARITQVLCDSALLEEKISGERFDLIFIDGSHSYEYTSNDTRFALSHLADRGTILWHDYGKRCWPGVQRALDEAYTSGLALRRIPKTSFVILAREEKTG